MILKFLVRFSDFISDQALSEFNDAICTDGGPVLHNEPTSHFIHLTDTSDDRAIAPAFLAVVLDKTHQLHRPALCENGTQCVIQLGETILVRMKPLLGEAPRFVDDLLVPVSAANGANCAARSATDI